MDITRTTLLVVVACLVATSSGYMAPSTPRDTYGGAPGPTHSKIHRRPDAVHGGVPGYPSGSVSRPAYQAPVRPAPAQWPAPAGHGSAYGKIAGTHVNAQGVRDQSRASLGAAHSSLQQAQAELQAGLGASLSSVRGTQADLQGTRAQLQASLGAAHSSVRGTQADLQGTRAQLEASLGAAHSSVRGTQADLQGTRDELQASLGAAHSSVRGTQADLQGTRDELQASLGAAHSSIRGTQADLQGTRDELQASLGAAHSSVREVQAELQETRTELHASLAAANASIQEARARAQAAIGQLAVFASQSQTKFALSTSYMLNKWRFTISQFFNPSKVKRPSIIVKDAAARGMVCVPVQSAGAFEVTADSGTSLGAETVSGGRGTVSEGIHGTVGERFEKLFSKEFQKSVKPDHIIGQGQGILVTVGGIGSTLAYGGQGATASAGLGATTTSTGWRGRGTGRGDGSASSTVTSSGKTEGSAIKASFSEGEYSGIHEGSSVDAGHVQSGSGPGVSAAAGAAAGGASSSAGRASASPGVLSASAGGFSTGGRVSTSSGGASLHATGTRSEFSSEAAAGHGYTHTDSSGSGSSSSAASLGSDGRVSLDVSGLDAEAAAVSAGGSKVHLSSTGGLTHFGPPECDCVEDYLCDEDGFINTSGAGVISIRSFSLGGGAAMDARCGDYHVCCRHREQRGRIAWEPHRCGTRSPSRLDRRLVSGEAARLGEFPWTVALQLVVPAGKVHDYLCGGSLIAPNIVLTGAHCVHRRRTEHLVARVGEWDTKSEDSVYPYQDLAVDEVIIHQQFDDETLRNDVALLRLKTPAELAAHINTICLPDQDHSHIDYSDCFTTGWGQKSFGKAVYSSLLKKVPLRKLNRGQCERRMHQTHLGEYFQLDETFICAGGRPSVDPCQGDGGSALVCRDTSSRYQDEETFVQVGIVAWDINCRRGGFPGVFVDVVRLAPWIRRTLATLTGQTQQSIY